MEAVASLLCLCAVRPVKLKVLQVESKEDQNPEESSSWCSSPMLIQSHGVCQALSDRSVPAGLQSSLCYSALQVKNPKLGQGKRLPRGHTAVDLGFSSAVLSLGYTMVSPDKIYAYGSPDQLIRLRHPSVGAF